MSEGWFCGVEMGIIQRQILAPVLIATSIVVATAVVTARGGDTQEPTKVNPDAAAIADFMKRVDAYVALHNKVESMLQEPAQDGRPEAVVEHQREFAKLMQKERQYAKPGDIITKPMRNVIRRLLASVFRGPDGPEIKRSILDTYTGNAVLQVNQTYPDNMPYSTVPLPILQGLPALPDALQYRFVGRRLILLDPHARLVVDIVENVFP
jgi:hypothetical protein